MRTQEQAFRAYYACMTDADLLAVAKNRSSFVPIAQTLVIEGLLRRQLAMPADAPAETSRASTLFTKLWQLMRREPPGQSEPARTERDRMVQVHQAPTEGTVPANHRTTPRSTNTLTSIGAKETRSA